MTDTQNQIISAIELNEESEKIADCIREKGWLNSESRFTVRIEARRLLKQGYKSYEIIELFSNLYKAVVEEEKRTTKNFKIGDKVYVVPGRPTYAFSYYIRAIITGISDKNGYLLRAFREDLPGIYMFNIWDDDLLPRLDKSKKELPPHLMASHSH